MRKWHKWLYMGIIVCSLMLMIVSTVLAAEEENTPYEPTEEEWDAMNVNLWFESLGVDSITIDKNNMPSLLAEPIVSIGNGADLGMVYAEMSGNSGMTGLGPGYLNDPDPWNYREYYEGVNGAFRRVYGTGFGEWQKYSNLVGTSSRYALMRWLKTGGSYRQAIYCIERGVDMDDSYTLTIEYSSVNDYVKDLNKINPQGWEGIQIASMFGCSVEMYTAAPSYKILNTIALDDPTFPIRTPDNTWQAHWWIDWYMATNQIYWEFQQGIRALRDDPGGAFTIDDAGYRSDAKSSLSAKGWSVTFLRDELNGTYARDIYDWMIDKIYGFANIPSYSVAKTSGNTVPTHTLTWSNERNRYDVIISETNGVDLSNISVSGVGIELVPGTTNQHYLYTTTATSGKACEGTTIVGEKLPTEAQPLFALDPGYDSYGNKVQTMMVGQAEIDPPVFVFNIKTKELTGTISGKKTSNTGKALKGAVFGLYSNSAATGTAIKTAASDTNGQFSFQDIPYGKYYVKEITAPAGYQLSGTIYTVEVGASTPNAVVKSGNIINYPNTAQLKVTKTSEDKKVVGFTFKVTGTSNLGNAVSVTATTNNAGVADFGQIELGTYKVEEILSTSQAATYNAVSSQNVTLSKQGEVKSLQFANTLKKGTIKGKKVNDQATAMAGVVFSLYKSDGTTWVADTTTDTNGVFTFSNIIYGTYVVKEKSTANHYELNATSYKVTLSDTAKTVWANGGSNIINYPSTGTVIVTKVINNKVNDYADVSLSGFTFKLSGKTALGRSYETLVTTDASGAAEMKNVPVGTYTLTETASANSNLAAYVYKAVSVTVTANNTSRVTFTNTVAIASLRVVKVDAEEQSGKLKGAVFEVSKKQPDGSYKYYGRMKDNGDGSYVLENITVGDYQLKEVQAPEYYIADTESYYFTVKKEDHGKEISIDALQNSNGENVFVNTPQKGVLIIEKEVEQDYFKKTDGTGFEFIVEGQFYTGGSKTWIVETTDIIKNEENKIIARAYVDNTGVKSGTYTITEGENTKTYGFILPKSCKVTINGGNEVIADFTGERGNKLMRGRVELVKVDQECPDIKLSGAEFRVYSKDGSLFKIMNEDMDDPGTYYLDGLPFGEYYVKEMKAPENYKIDPQSYSFIIDEDNETIRIANDGGSFFENRPETGNIKIWKELEKYESAESLEAVSMDKIVFRIVGTANTGQSIDFEVRIGESKEIIEQGRSIKVTGVKVNEESGYILIEGLRMGTYQIEEVDDELLRGYYETVPQTVVVESDGITQEVSFYNQLRRGTITFQKHLAGEVNVPIEGAVLRLEIKDYLREWEGGVSEDDLKNAWLQDENGYYQWRYLDERITDEEGKVRFADLVVGSYRVTETQAPEGYQLMAKPIEFILPYNQSDSTERNAVLDETFLLGEQMIWSIPNSGGTGIGQYFALGVSLILASLVGINLKKV